MASPMPESIEISIEEYANLLMTKEAADYVYGIIWGVAYDPHIHGGAKDFARNLLDEWTK